MEYLVDTNILSELFRKRPNELILDWIKNQDRIAISTITVEELEFGLRYLNNTKYLQWFHEMISTLEVVPVCDLVALKAGELRGHFRQKGIQRTQADMIIGASALIHHLILVTLNEKDFLGMGLKIFNPNYLVGSR